MSFFLLSRTATQELIQIEAFIAERNRAAAPQVIQVILEACKMLADFPQTGWELRRSGTQVKSERRLKWTCGDHYIIVYRPVRGGIRVIRVIDGRQDPARYRLFKR